MSPDSLLQRLKDDLEPHGDQKARIRAMMEGKMKVHPMLKQALQEAQPDASTQSVLWQKVLSRIDSPQLASIFDRLRQLLNPSSDQQSKVRLMLMPRLAPVGETTSYRFTKWVAAFALILMGLRISPVLFLAPPSAASSSVIVTPTQGTVLVAAQGLWLPLSEETVVRQGMQLKTEDGQATIILHDDGTIRMDANTTITLHDVSNRPEPAFDGPTLTLVEGRIWVQGLLPQHLRGITASTNQGQVTVHGGSVSISVDDNGTSVRVWNRRADVVYRGQSGDTLVAGERTQLGQDETMRIRMIEDKEYDEQWVTQNLERDAVHQREVAQMQRERSAASAGILPNSPLYPVKRVAERVDVLLTLNEESRVQKKLQQASTRLNEAAAMLAEGQSGATLLEEYKQAIIAVATGSGDSVTQFLVQQEVAENTAGLAAALPDDDLYALKRTVLEASAELPVEVVDAADVQGMIIVDTIDVLNDAIESGDTDRAQETYDAIQPFIASLEEENDESLKPDVKKEVLSLLTSAAEKLQESGTGSMTTEIAESLSPFLPEPEVPAHLPLTQEQIADMIEGIRRRIFTYSQQRSRWNQLQHELRQLKGHPDEGMILRQLYSALPENGLARYVRTAIQDLREEINE